LSEITTWRMKLKYTGIPITSYDNFLCADQGECAVYHGAAHDTTYLHQPNPL
jgi:hypothetical protein